MSELAVSTGQMNPMAVAQVFRASGMFPDIQSEAQAATKIIIGRGLGLTDFDAMSGLHIIKGKAVLAANLMAAAIKRAGKYDYRAMVTDEEARIEFRQRKHDGGWETIGISSFTMEDAKRANLGGDNWRKYPRAMLFARCISAGYKQHCPDALGAAPVYVEAHGEKEIEEDTPPPPPAPKPVKALSREERRADTERLLAPAPAAAEPAKAAPPRKTGTLQLVAKSFSISTVKKDDGTKVFRVDVDGNEEPYAIKDPKIAHLLESESAFGHDISALWEENAQGRKVIVEVLNA